VHDDLPVPAIVWTRAHPRVSCLQTLALRPPRSRACTRSHLGHRAVTEPAGARSREPYAESARPDAQLLGRLWQILHKGPQDRLKHIQPSSSVMSPSFSVLLTARAEEKGCTCPRATDCPAPRRRPRTCFGLLHSQQDRLTELLGSAPADKRCSIFAIDEQRQYEAERKAQRETPGHLDQSSRANPTHPRRLRGPCHR